MQRDGRQAITATSGTQTVNDATGIVYIDPASLATTMTVKMNPNPQDEDEVSICFGGTIGLGSTVVTALTWAANTGQTLLNTPITTAIAGQTVVWRYRKSNTSWYCISKS